MSLKDPVQNGLISKAQEDVPNTNIHPFDLRRLWIASAESKQQAPSSHSKQMKFEPEQTPWFLCRIANTLGW